MLLPVNSNKFFKTFSSASLELTGWFSQSNNYQTRLTGSYKAAGLLSYLKLNGTHEIYHLAVTCIFHPNIFKFYFPPFFPAAPLYLILLILKYRAGNKSKHLPGVLHCHMISHRMMNAKKLTYQFVVLTFLLIFFLNVKISECQGFSYFSAHRFCLNRKTAICAVSWPPARELWNSPHCVSQTVSTCTNETHRSWTLQSHLTCNAQWMQAYFCLWNTRQNCNRPISCNFDRVFTQLILWQIKKEKITSIQKDLP